MTSKKVEELWNVSTNELQQVHFTMSDYYLGFIIGESYPGWEEIEQFRRYLFLLSYGIEANPTSKTWGRACEIIEERLGEF